MRGGGFYISLRTSLRLRFVLKCRPGGRDHAEEFAALSRLTVDPGYKNEISLGTKLYKLAAKYPLADHFRWRG